MWKTYNDTHVFIFQHFVNIGIGGHCKTLIYDSEYVYRDPFLLNILTAIPAWLSYYIDYKV